jgi:hypothetical protein
MTEPNKIKEVLDKIDELHHEAKLASNKLTNYIRQPSMRSVMFELCNRRGHCNGCRLMKEDHCLVDDLD